MDCSDRSLMSIPIPRPHDQSVLANAEAGPSRRSTVTPVSISASASTSTEGNKHISPSKGKSRAHGSGSRPGLVREVESATISFRQGAVDLLDEASDEDGDVAADVGGSGLGASRDLLSVPTPPTTSKSPVRSPRLARSGSSFDSRSPVRTHDGSRQTSYHRPPLAHGPRSPSSSSSRTTSITLNNVNTRSISHSPSQSKSRVIQNQTRGPAPQPQTQPRRRGRANSLHFPAPPESPQDPHSKNYLLSHYSTDRAYSLAPTKRQQQLQFELGLGDDFDHSFGEAMRNGVGGAEMPLPQEALRVLSQAKENMDLRLVGKKGRKGSLGMGLFKESRERSGSTAGSGTASCALPGEIMGIKGVGVARVQEQAVIEEDEISTTPSLEAPTKPSAIVQPTPYHPPELSLLPAPTSQDSDDERDLSTQTAAITIVSSPLLRHSPHSPSRRRISSVPESAQFSSYDESGWTTTGSDESSTELSEVASKHSHDEAVGSRSGSEDNSHSSSGEEDEGESMTVPLQPFDHAVGGHSSIYKFTRRAVCKVSPRYRFNSQGDRVMLMRDSSHWLVVRICFMKRSSVSPLLYWPIYPAISVSCSSITAELSVPYPLPTVQATRPSRQLLMVDPLILLLHLHQARPALPCMLLLLARPFSVLPQRPDKTIQHSKYRKYHSTTIDTSYLIGSPRLRILVNIDIAVVEVEGQVKRIFGSHLVKHYALLPLVHKSSLVVGSNKKVNLPPAHGVATLSCPLHPRFGRSHRHLLVELPYLDPSRKMNLPHLLLPPLNHLFTVDLYPNMDNYTIQPHRPFCLSDHHALMPYSLITRVDTLPVLPRLIPDSAEQALRQ